MVCVGGAGGNPIILQSSPPPPTHMHLQGRESSYPSLTPHCPIWLPQRLDKLSPSSRNKLREAGIAALTHSHSQLQLGVFTAFGWGSIQERLPPGPEARTACWSPPLPSTHFRCPKLGQQRSFPVGQLAPASLPLPCSGPRLPAPPPRAPRGLTTSQPPFDTWGLCGAGGRGPALSPNTSRAGAPGQARVRAQPAAHAAPPLPAPPRSGRDTSLSYFGWGGRRERKLEIESSAPHPFEWQPSASRAQTRSYNNTVATPTPGRGRCASAGGGRMIGRILPSRPHSLLGSGVRSWL